MITKLVALFIVSNALAVFGRDPLPAATYTQVLDQVSIPGRITGIVGGYDKSADPRQTGDQGPYRFY
jgi:hypothetical protein